MRTLMPSLAKKKEEITVQFSNEEHMVDTRSGKAGQQGQDLEHWILKHRETPGILENT